MTLDSKEEQLLKEIPQLARELAEGIDKVLAYDREHVSSEYWAQLERHRNRLAPIMEELRLIGRQPLTALLWGEKNELKRLLDELRGIIQNLEYRGEEHPMPRPLSDLVGDLENTLSNKAILRVLCTRSYLASKALQADARLKELLDNTKLLADAAEEAKRRADKAAEEIQEQAAAFKDTIDGLVSEANKTLQLVREQAARETVSKYGQHFAAAAKEHQDRSARALWWSIGLGSALTLGACVLAACLAEQALKAAPLLIPAVGVLSLALVIALRILLAERHNQTLCEHKQRALESFEAFLAATGDARIKDAVLAHVASAIYGNVTTGYAKGPLEVPHPPFSIVANVTDPADRP